MYRCDLYVYAPSLYIHSLEVSLKFKLLVSFEGIACTWKLARQKFEIHIYISECDFAGVHLLLRVCDLSPRLLVYVYSSNPDPPGP